MPNTVINTRVVLQGVGYDPIINNWLNYLTNKPSKSYLQKLNRFVIANKANLLLRDRFFIFAQEAGCQQACTISLINPESTPLVEVNSPTWTALQGYTGNGSSMYLNTKYNPSTHGVKFQQNDGNMDLYTRLSIAAAAKFCAGAFSGGTQVTLALNYTGFGKLWAANAAGQSINANNTTQGLYSDTRNAASGAASTILYKNGSTLASANVVSTALVNAELYIMCFSNAITPTSYDTNEYSRWSIGASVGMNYLLDYTSWQKFMTELGTQV